MCFLNDLTLSNNLQFGDGTAAWNWINASFHYLRKQPNSIALCQEKKNVKNIKYFLGYCLTFSRTGYFYKNTFLFLAEIVESSTHFTEYKEEDVIGLKI